MNIEKIAKLANLKLSKKEELKFQKEMEAILKYIDKLNELKIDPIKPSSFMRLSTFFARIIPILNP